MCLLGGRAAWRDTKVPSPFGVAIRKFRDTGTRLHVSLSADLSSLARERGGTSGYQTSECKCTYWRISRLTSTYASSTAQRKYVSPRFGPRDTYLPWSDFDDPWRALAWAMKMVVLPLNTACSWCCEFEGQIGVGGLLGTLECCRRARVSESYVALTPTAALIHGGERSTVSEVRGSRPVGTPIRTLPTIAGRWAFVATGVGTARMGRSAADAQLSRPHSAAG